VEVDLLNIEDGDDDEAYEHRLGLVAW
jgi:hypothetical protein